MRALDAAPLAVLTAGALLAVPHVPVELSPWIVAGAFFHGGKWIAWQDARRTRLVRSRTRAVAWFLLWPGMDARAYFDEERRPGRPGIGEWALAAAKTLVGAWLVWGLARRAPDDQPILQGWIGLLGMAWFLLFGVFHLLSCAGRRMGVDTQPVWRAPVFATSLGDFWGNRWNLAFRDLARIAVFRPLLRRVGARGAFLAVFAASGLVHEAVISVPARGGYGLCLGYFALQALGVLLDGSSLGARLGIRRGLRGWLFAMALTAPTAYLLFHPPFVERAYVPFLRGIGALGPPATARVLSGGPERGTSVPFTRSTGTAPRPSTTSRACSATSVQGKAVWSVVTTTQSASARAVGVGATRERTRSPTATVSTKGSA
jgi:membrane bound O-acyltransferase family protein